MSLSYAQGDRTETHHNGKEWCDHWDASVQEHVGEQGRHGEGGFPPPTHCHCCRFSTGWSSLWWIILLCVRGIVYFRLQLDFFWHVTVFPGIKLGVSQFQRRDSQGRRNSTESENGSHALYCCGKGIRERFVHLREHSTLYTRRDSPIPRTARDSMPAPNWNLHS